ncbi:hypothetical protein JMUB7507_26490 [Staphylococcus aureus]
MSDNNGLESRYEVVQKSNMIESEKGEAIRPYNLRIVDRKEEIL